MAKQPSTYSFVYALARSKALTQNVEVAIYRLPNGTFTLDKPAGIENAYSWVRAAS